MPPRKNPTSENFMVEEAALKKSRPDVSSGEETDSGRETSAEEAPAETNTAKKGPMKTTPKKVTTKTTSTQKRNQRATAKKKDASKSSKATESTTAQTRAPKKLKAATTNKGGLTTNAEVAIAPNATGPQGLDNLPKKLDNAVHEVADLIYVILMLLIRAFGKS